MTTPNPKLNNAQRAALAALAADAAAHVEPATLSKLRKLGLVGKLVTKQDGRQKTTSPVTDAGKAMLHSQRPHDDGLVEFEPEEDWERDLAERAPKGVEFEPEEDDER